MNLRDERHRDLLLVKSIPIKILEKYVRFDLLSAISAKPSLWIDGEQSFEQIDCLWREVLSHDYWFSQAVLQHLLFILGIERRGPTEHLIDKRPKTPPITRKIMTPILIDLRCQIFRCAAESIALFARAHHNFRQSEVSDLQIAVSTHQYIFRLEIPVDCVLPVQIVQRHDNLGGIQASAMLSKLPIFAQMEEQFAANHEVHDQVQSGCGLECVVQLHDEGTSHVLEDFTLCSGVDLLVSLQDELLLDDFHGV